MGTTYTDTINGQPITIAMEAEAWQEPAITSWWSRCRELNRMLQEATHLLRLDSDDAEPTWYAGTAGTSLAAGVEQMTVQHDIMQDSLVAFPLDTRIYVAELEKGLVKRERIQYPDAFETSVQSWRQRGRKLTLLTNGGNQSVDMPNAAEIPVDIDTAAMTFRHASIALLRVGVVRWRDCMAALGISVLAVGISFAITWWQRTPSVEPLQLAASLVTQPAAPVRHTASAELATLAALAAEYDIELWHAHQATELSYTAADGTLELRSATVAPVVASLGPLPQIPESVLLLPYTIHAFRTQLAAHLDSPSWTLTFGDPYPVGDEELEQHVTLTIGSVDPANDVSVPLSLVDLSERLIRLPITLHHVNCAINEGVLTACNLNFAIRGSDV